MSNRQSTPVQGLPTARSADHVGLNVRDLDASIQFFERMLGAELLFRAGPFEDPDGDWMENQLGVHPRAKASLAMLRFGPTMNVELLAFEGPGSDAAEPGYGAVGAAHLAIYVDDVEAAAAHLAAQPGVKVLGRPLTLGGDLPHAGTTLLFVATPIGVRLELVSRRDPLPYEAETSGRMWGPAYRWDPNARTEE